MNNIETVLKEAVKKIDGAKDLRTLEALKTEYLGKNGSVAVLLKSISQYPPEERKNIGFLANKAKTDIEQALDNKREKLSRKVFENKIKSERLDFSPSFAFHFAKGHFHPISQTIENISAIFKSLGFEIVDGPEIETDWYNFEALNHPPDHPARDIQDTFYLEGMKNLLRTHTSPGQIHAMESRQPPIKVIVPGRVYRNEASDASHSSTFHQVEGLFVDSNVSFVDLKNTLNIYAKSFFGADLQTRFRPSYFPFTEPSAEMDVQCFFCKGKGCNLCKGTGWIEILGCGMVHPNVLKAVKYDSEKYTGYAFGIGVERMTMLKYGIDDIRLFYENDLRFLKQF